MPNKDNPTEELKIARISGTYPRNIGELKNDPVYCLSTRDLQEAMESGNLTDNEHQTIATGYLHFFEVDIADKSGYDNNAISKILEKLSPDARSRRLRISLKQLPDE